MITPLALAAIVTFLAVAFAFENGWRQIALLYAVAAAGFLLAILFNSVLAGLGGFSVLSMATYATITQASGWRLH